MTQPTPHPHDVANLLVPAVSSVVGALADRGGTSIPEYDARAQETWTLVQSFRPRDSMDLMLVGEFVAFHELLADGTRDLLRGMTEAMKIRSRAGLVAIGRVCLGYADRLEKRGLEPYRAEIAAQTLEREAMPSSPEQAASPQPPQAKTAEPPMAAAEPPAPAPDASAPSGAVTPRDAVNGVNPFGPVPNGGRAPDGTEATASVADPPAGAASWLDEPYQEWVVETPADLAFKANMARMKDLMKEVRRRHPVPAAPLTAAPGESDPRQPEYMLAEASAGD